MADGGSSAVYSGFWLDHDRGGRVRGATLTLTNQRAAALLAFLAIVVTFAANRSFKICRFCLHRLIHPSDVEPDSVRWAKRKRQVILRNKETPVGALMSLLETTVSERIASPVSRRAILKSVLLKLFITGHWLVFIALSILTSQTVIGRTVVSKKMDTCGIWAIKESPENSDEYGRALNELWYNVTLNVNNYVHNCYGDTTAQGFFDCTKFVSRSLSFSEEHNVPCPFAPGFCVGGENSAFAMDSGNISFSALGMNQKRAKDMAVRRRTTCAVVDSDPFYVGILTSEDSPIALAGNQTALQYAFVTDQSGVNQTFVYRNESFLDTYDLRSSTWFGNSSDSNFTLVNKVLQPNRNTNDVTIMLLRGPGVEFFDVQDDPWFAAHRKVSWDNSTGRRSPSYTRYEMDNHINVLVCDERAQVCNHVTSQCTEWHGLVNAFEDVVSTTGDGLLKEDMDGFDGMALASLNVGQSISYSYISNSIQGRSHAALQATRYFYAGSQYRLDPEQWKVELRYWFKMALARIQLDIFSTIERRADVDPERTYNLWDAETLDLFCGNVKFRSSNHTSLSTAGIVVILLCTAILTLISFLDQVVASRFLRRWSQNFIAPWEETEILALLNTIHEVSKEEERLMPALAPARSTRLADGFVVLGKEQHDERE
jgi:hypothetical protein